jgi:hypothetical protein
VIETIPLLPLYAFIAWAGIALPFTNVRVLLTEGQDVYIKTWCGYLENTHTEGQEKTEEALRITF